MACSRRLAASCGDADGSPGSPRRTGSSSQASPRVLKACAITSICPTRSWTQATKALPRRSTATWSWWIRPTVRNTPRPGPSPGPRTAPRIWRSSSPSASQIASPRPSGFRASRGVVPSPKGSRMRAGEAPGPMGMVHSLPAFSQSSTPRPWRSRATRASPIRPRSTTAGVRHRMAAASAGVGRNPWAKRLRRSRAMMRSRSEGGGRE